MVLRSRRCHRTRRRAHALRNGDRIVRAGERVGVWTSSAARADELLTVPRGIVGGMQIPKPTEQDKAGFRALVPGDPSVVIKPMFGNLGAFVNGNMFAGLFGSTAGVRLVEDSSRRELEAVEGTGPFGPVERPMGGYVALPADWAAHPERSASWIEVALAQVRALPAKTPKPKAAKRSR